MMPLRLIRPSVGLMPTRLLAAAGEVIEPSVSVPTATAARLAAIDAPEPALEPLVLRSSEYGFLLKPPRPLQPEEERVERKLAHSLKLVLPIITQPAARNFSTMKASRCGLMPTMASEPAVVCILSAVAILSLIRIGMPCIGPRGPFVLRSLSSASAIASASGLSSMTELMRGPVLSIALMRAR